MRRQDVPAGRPDAAMYSLLILLELLLQNDVREYVVNDARRDLDQQYFAVDNDALVAFRWRRQNIAQTVWQVLFCNARRQRFPAGEILGNSRRQAFGLFLALAMTRAMTRTMALVPGTDDFDLAGRKYDLNAELSSECGVSEEQ